MKEFEGFILKISGENSHALYNDVLVFLCCTDFADDTDLYLNCCFNYL